MKQKKSAPKKRTKKDQLVTINPEPSKKIGPEPKKNTKKTTTPNTTTNNTKLATTPQITLNDLRKEILKAEQQKIPTKITRIGEPLHLAKLLNLTTTQYETTQQTFHQTITYTHSYEQLLANLLEPYTTPTKKKNSRNPVELFILGMEFERAQQVKTNNPLGGDLNILRPFEDLKSSNEVRTGLLQIIRKTVEKFLPGGNSQ